MAKQTDKKSVAPKKDTTVKEASVKKTVTKRKGKSVSTGSDEIDDIFSKKKISDASEIDDIFNTKSLKDDKVDNKVKEAPLSKSAKRKAAKKSKKSGEDKKDEEEGDHAGEEHEEEEEELSEEQVKKVEEVVFAELAAIKNSNPSKKRPAPPPSADEDFGDSRGIKKTNRTTEDGYPLYDVKDLNIGGGLDTPECPFDCKCCF